MRRCIVFLAFPVLLLFATPHSVFADGAGLCVLGNVNAEQGRGSLARPEAAMQASAAPFVHEMLGQEAIASPEHYPLGAMLLRPKGASEVSSEVAAGPEHALVRLQLLSYGDSCARRIAMLLEGRRSAYLRMPLALDYVSRQRSPLENARLQPGDIAYLPPLPSSVMVVGAVKSPGMLDFYPDADARAYIHAAGGWGKGANQSETFVYLPDGQRRRLPATFWNYERRNVPPGSVIVVPGRGVDLAKQSRALAPTGVPEEAETIGILPHLQLDPTLKRSAPEPDASPQ